LSIAGSWVCGPGYDAHHKGQAPHIHAFHKHSPFCVVLASNKPAPPLQLKVYLKFYLKSNTFWKNSLWAVWFVMLAEMAGIKIPPDNPRVFQIKADSCYFFSDWR
jgi:hypothetical protein